MQLAGNTILVTGGGSGIGCGLAEALHRLGNEVIIAGRRRERLHTVASTNAGMQYMLLDQADPDGVRRFAAELTGRHPGLNVVINNAGIMAVEDLLAGDATAAEAMVAVNLLGPIRLTAALLPALRTQPRAAILNVTSGFAFVPKAATPTYCATKAAMHSYTESLRFQLHHTAIEVIEIIPPRVQTEILAELEPDPNVTPADSYITQVMTLLHTQPAAKEIVVDRVKPVRSAACDGGYDELFAAVNQAAAPS